MDQLNDEPTHLSGGFQMDPDVFPKEVGKLTKHFHWEQMKKMGEAVKQCMEHPAKIRICITKPVPSYYKYNIRYPVSFPSELIDQNIDLLYYEHDELWIKEREMILEGQDMKCKKCEIILSDCISFAQEYQIIKKKIEDFELDNIDFQENGKIDIPTEYVSSQVDDMDLLQDEDEMFVLVEDKIQCKFKENLDFSVDNHKVSEDVFSQFLRRFVSYFEWQNQDGQKMKNIVLILLVMFSPNLLEKYKMIYRWNLDRYKPAKPRWCRLRDMMELDDLYED